MASTERLELPHRFTDYYWFSRPVPYQIRVKWTYWAVLPVTLWFQEGHNFLCYYYTKDYMLEKRERFALTNTEVAAPPLRLLGYRSIFGA